jgi:hypothetical protein
MPHTHIFKVRFPNVSSGCLFVVILPPPNDSGGSRDVRVPELQDGGPFLPRKTKKHNLTTDQDCDAGMIMRI